MDNIILKGMLNEFSGRFDLVDETEEYRFEKFVNYCILKTDYYDSFDFDKVATGQATGVDGVAVVIGGVIVNEIDDAKSLTRQQFNAEFHFIQTKTSTSFDLGEYLKFTATVRAFFTDQRAGIPGELANAFDIKEEVYQRSAKLRELPSVHLHYAYAGQNRLTDSNILAAIENERVALAAEKYKFSDVGLEIHDGDGIAALYRATKNDINGKLSFQRHTAIPQIPGATAAYLGVARCSDYVRLLCKPNGELNKALFTENVRDFLGVSNPVNSAIQKTVLDPNERDRFAVLNNGVTVVAGKVIPSGDTFELSRFQIVNGCQTSHVLYERKNDLSDAMYITVKLIETTNIDLYGRIIATTNSQSHVTKEAFATIRPYHKVLEDFYNAMRSSGFSYYYERRPHQFDYDDDIPQRSVISAPQLIKCFISVAMEEPHKVHYYYGNLLQEYNQNETSEIFSETDYPGLYFVCGHIISELKIRFSRDQQMKNWIFHLGLLIKKQIAPWIKKTGIQKDSKFLESLSTLETGFDRACINAVKVIKSLRLDRNQNRNPEITKLLIRKLHEAQQEASRQAQPQEAAPSPAKARVIALLDGDYIGIVEAVNCSGGQKLIDLKYGPFIMQLNGAGLHTLTESAKGKAARFRINGESKELLEIVESSV
ncbi:AIPR family protein [Geomonas oryzisoli]|uniref:AIPR family protein n=1 Tax=Geomonas oryzisoli TaxID=2847992 RepID=A0ABX8JA04_9BACT|nr:AIPR family protein [Geomonas oryzisoli]QWV94648.1 AIPR family protein [Geomonas oryzisoli]